MRPLAFGAVVLIACILLLAGAHFLWKNRSAPWLAPWIGRDINQPLPGALDDRVSFACVNDASIEAYFYGDRVSLALSDGRSITLPLVPAEEGARYEHETFAFSVVGNGATLMEDGVATLENCVLLPDAVDGKRVYGDAELGISFAYPLDYFLDEAHRYQLSPARVIAGVSLTIPARMREGTNLSADTYLSVEYAPNVDGCSALLFAHTRETVSAVDGEREYSLATTTEGAAGNIYEEWVYALPETDPCIALRYFVHSTRLENYDPGTVRAYDRAALLAAFDAIRRSLVVRDGM